MTNDESTLPISVLRTLISLEIQTGRMTWLLRDVSMFTSDPTRTAEAACRSWNSRLAGKRAVNSKQGMGYLHGSILDRKYLAHRVVWALHTGAWPEHTIDHINGNKVDNGPSNLRDVPHKMNCRNQRLRSNNTTGHNGVSFDKARGKFAVLVTIDSKTSHIGRFATIEEALSARNAAYKANGFHNNHGVVRS